MPRCGAACICPWTNSVMMSYCVCDLSWEHLCGRSMATNDLYYMERHNNQLQLFTNCLTFFPYSFWNNCLEFVMFCFVVSCYIGIQFGRFLISNLQYIHCFFMPSTIFGEHKDFPLSVRQSVGTFLRSPKLQGVVCNLKSKSSRAIKPFTNICWHVNSHTRVYWF